MKHVDVKIRKSKNGYRLGDVIATITGNNFGDQIITFRVYSNIPLSKAVSIEGVSCTECTGFKDIWSETFFEGEHLTEEKIIQLYKNSVVCSTS